MPGARSTTSATRRELHHSASCASAWARRLARVGGPLGGSINLIKPVLNFSLALNQWAAGGVAKSRDHELAVGLDADAIPQAVGDQRLLRLGQAQFPRGARVAQ